MIRPLVGRCSAAILLALALAHAAGQERYPDALRNVRSLLGEGLYDRAEAAARAEVDNLRVSLGDSSPELAAASDVLVRALILNGRAAHDQTLALARRTLRTKEAHLGAQHPELVTSLLNLGDVLAADAEFEEAIAITRRAVLLREKNTAPNSLGVAEALDHLGSTLTQARRYEDALKALDRSLAIKEDVLDEKDAAIARTLEAIGWVLQFKGIYERAGPPIRRALAIQEAADVDHPAYAETLNLVAQQLWFEGRLIESRNASEQAVAIAERTLRADHPTVGSVAPTTRVDP